MSGYHLRKSGILVLLIFSLLANFTRANAAPAFFPSNLENTLPAAPHRVYMPFVSQDGAAEAINTPQPVGQVVPWRLVFSDDFNGPGVDPSKWRTCFWWADSTCSITPNGELELYNPGDVLVQNGVLRLRAQKQAMLGWDGRSYAYTSGMVMTGGRSGSIPPEFAFTYGYAEARIKIPAGQGLWPAFWLLPTSYSWPPEIDIMEILGRSPRLISMTYHYSSTGSQGIDWSGPDFSAGWHVVGLDWEPAALTWYVDGVARARFTNAGLIPKSPMYVLLNLAVGGSWEGPPDAKTVFPSYFDVDYVRVWQK